MISTRIENITPEMARHYLTKNTNNFRKVKNRVVMQYANDMKAGKWVLNGEGIMFSKDGSLINGQHRLKAIIQSGCTVPMMIIEGIEGNAKDVVFDLGFKRSVANYLGTSGTSVAAITAIMLNKFRNYGVGQSEMIEYSNKHFDEMLEAITISRYGQSNSICRKAAIQACIYLMLKTGEVTKSEAEEFCRVVSTGVPVDLDRSATPALVLRRQIMAMKTSGGREAQKYIAEVTYKAIKDFVKGNIRVKNYPDEPPMFIKLIDRVLKMEEAEG